MRRNVVNVNKEACARRVCVLLLLIKITPTSASYIETGHKWIGFSPVLAPCLECQAPDDAVLMRRNVVNVNKEACARRVCVLLLLIKITPTSASYIETGHKWIGFSPVLAPCLECQGWSSLFMFFFSF